MPAQKIFVAIVKLCPICELYPVECGLNHAKSSLESFMRTIPIFGSRVNTILKAVFGFQFVQNLKQFDGVASKWMGKMDVKGKNPFKATGKRGKCKDATPQIRA